MPTLRLIDRVNGEPTEGPFAIPPESHIFAVTDRDTAYRILKADLRQTADREWSNDILAAFESGENDITRPNGVNASFTVQFEG